MTKITKSDIIIEKYYGKGCVIMLHFSDALYQLMAIIMSLLMTFGGITMPSTDDTLKTKDPSTVLDFVVTGDTQVSNIMPEMTPEFIFSRISSKSASSSAIKPVVFNVLGFSSVCVSSVGAKLISPWKSS